jgi:hypothetical protein
VDRLIWLSYLQMAELALSPQSRGIAPPLSLWGWISLLSKATGISNLSLSLFIPRKRKHKKPSDGIHSNNCAPPRPENHSPVSQERPNNPPTNRLHRNPHLSIQSPRNQYPESVALNNHYVQEIRQKALHETLPNPTSRRHNRLLDRP